MKETIRFNNAQASEFVKAALWAMDYPPEIDITTNISEDERVSFQASYETMYHGKTTKCIMPIRKGNFIELMKIGMSLKGYTPEHVHFSVRNRKVQFEAVTEIISYDNLTRKRRKG